MPSPHVLIVEDDQFLSDAYRAELKKHRYDVTMATDGEEALTAVHKKKPDLIILDLAMPKKNGVEVLRDWHKQGLTPKIPVVVASNLENPDVRETCLKLGACDYIIKSNITLPDLINLCNKYLSRETAPKKTKKAKKTTS